MGMGAGQERKEKGKGEMMRWEGNVGQALGSRRVRNVMRIITDTGTRHVSLNL
jgi:hypothetical protein